MGRQVMGHHGAKMCQHTPTDTLLYACTVHRPSDTRKFSRNKSKGIKDNLNFKHAIRVSSNLQPVKHLGAMSECTLMKMRRRETFHAEEFKCRCNLKLHMRVHSREKTFVCNHCGKGFTEGSALNVHRRNHTGEQPYSCSICNKRFISKRLLMRHTRCHLNIKPYGCKECGKTFVESSKYNVHLRIHTGERPYKCTVCFKTFVEKITLSRHMFTHNREQNLMTECEVCGDSFKTTYMNIHMRTHTRVKPHKCRFCEATFGKSSNRLRHEEVHSNRKAVQCKECGKSLSTTDHLKIHMRCHTGEKAYKCGYCEKTFAWPTTHKKHEVTHTKEYPYNCAECGKGYVDRRELVKHLPTHRPVASTSEEQTDGNIVMSNKAFL